MNLPDYFVLISLDNNRRKATQSEIVGMIALFDAVQVLGSYKGKEETSFIVDYRFQSMMIDLAAKYDQESILIKKPYSVDLVFIDSLDRKEIGKDFINVGPEKPDVDAWTKIGDNYYIVK